MPRDLTARWNLPVAFVVFGLAWVLLDAAHLPHPVHDDTLEDLLRARTCAEEQLCEGEGAATRLRGVRQGALFVSLIAAARSAGASVELLHGVSFALAAFGATILFGVLARRREPFVGFVTAALFSAALIASGVLEVLWNPSLIPLPTALLLAAALLYVERPTLARLVPLAAALGLALETHPVAALLLPGAAWIAGAYATSPARSAVAAASVPAAAWGIHAAMSPAAALGNARFAVDHVGEVGVALGAFAIVAVAIAARRPIAERLASSRGVAAAVALVAPFLALPVLGPTVFSSDVIEPRYLAAAFAPTAYLVAALAAVVASSPGARAGLALVGAGAGLACLPTPAPPDAPSLGALESVLAEEPIGVDEAWARLSGPRCRSQVAAVAALGGALGPGEGWSDEALVLGSAAVFDGASEPGVRLPRRGGWRRISTGAGPVLVGAMPTWIDRQRFEVCVDRGEDTERRCRPVDLRRGVVASFASAEGGLRLSWLSDPSLGYPGAYVHDGPPPPTRARYTLPVRVPTGREQQRLVHGPRHPPCVRAAFVGSSRVGVADPLPAESVTIDGADHPQEGTLTYEVDVSGCDDEPLAVFAPCLSEVSPRDDPGLRALLTP